MVNRKRKMISAALSTALVVTMLLTASTVDAQGTQPAKTAGDKKVEVIIYEDSMESYNCEAIQ